MSTTKTQAPTSELTRSVREKHKEFLFPATLQYYKEPIVLTEGKGLRIRDADGNEYLDFFGGILTVSIGHADDRVNAAVRAQLDRLSHVSTLYPTLPVVELAERLARLTPGNLKQTYFTASGTEADETGVMMAELATGSTEIIALRHGYSGRSTLAHPSTDDLIQWTAHKWGIPEDVVRAQMAVESWWRQSDMGDLTAESDPGAFPAFSCPAGGPRCDSFRDQIQPHVFDVERGLPVTRELDQVVDQHAQLTGLSQRGRGQRRNARVVRPFREQFEVGDQAGERGAQLVRGVGDQPALRARRFVQRGRHRGECLPEPADLVLAWRLDRRAEVAGGPDPLDGFGQPADRAQHPARGQPSRLLVAKNASTKNTEVTTTAAAFTHQEKREPSPIASRSTPSTT